MAHDWDGLRPVSSWAELEGTWQLEDMYTVTPLAAGAKGVCPAEVQRDAAGNTVSHPFGRQLRGFIVYTTCGDVRKVNALITSTVPQRDTPTPVGPAPLGSVGAASSSTGVEDVGLGDFFWSQPAEHGRLVTSYVGNVTMTHAHDSSNNSAVTKSAQSCFLDHHVTGSAHPGYAGLTLRREAFIGSIAASPSRSTEVLVLTGSLGMKRGVRGVIVWSRGTSTSTVPSGDTVPTSGISKL